MNTREQLKCKITSYATVDSLVDNNAFLSEVGYCFRRIASRCLYIHRNC